jgi:hypothetical protein
MKAKVIIVSIVFLIFCFQNVSGQRSITDNYYQIAYEPVLTGELFAPQSIADAATYFNSEWLSGDIYLTNGEIVRNKFIKYNGLVDELFWHEPKSGNIVKLDKEPVLQFHFRNLKGDTSVYFRKIRAKLNIISDSADVYGEVVCDGSISLFVIHTFNIKGTEIIHTDGASFEKAVYSEEPIYIFRLANNKTFITRSLSRSSLYSFSPGNKDKIKEFMKANKSRAPINNSYLRKLTQFLETIVNLK